MTQRPPVIHNEDGSETVLPFRWIICGQCNGNGTSSAYLGAYTQADMDEAGPEFREDYFAGRYDRECETCGGSGKIMVADEKRMTKAQVRELREQRRADREIDAIHAAERRMGA